MLAKFVIVIIIIYHLFSFIIDSASVVVCNGCR